MGYAPHATLGSTELGQEISFSVTTGVSLGLPDEVAYEISTTIGFSVSFSASVPDAVVWGYTNINGDVARWEVDI